MAPKRKVEELETSEIIANTPEKMVVQGEETSGIEKYILVDSIYNYYIITIADSPDFSSCASS